MSMDDTQAMAEGNKAIGFLAAMIPARRAVAQSPLCEVGLSTAAHAWFQGGQMTEHAIRSVYPWGDIHHMNFTLGV